METSAECYAMAEHCERKALEARSVLARETLLDVAAGWRTVGDDLKAREEGRIEGRFLDQNAGFKPDLHSLRTGRMWG